MKVTVCMVLIIAVAGAAHARRNLMAASDVAVCMEGAGPDPEFGLAHTIAGSVYAKIGVHIDWRGEKDCPADGIRIGISRNTPEELKPGALAYALPYEGRHVVLFLDRVRVTVPHGREPALLAYVLVHEIGHILEGTSRHSDAGIMKAHWTQADYVNMSNLSMGFVEEDVELIQTGLGRRMEVLAAAEEQMADGRH